MHAMRSAAGLASAAVLALGATAAQASIVYTYSGNALGYIPPPGCAFPCPNPNPFGASVTGRAVFDDTVVTPDFTGSIAYDAYTLYTVTMGNTTMGTRGARGYNAATAFTFVDGQITGWNLLSQGHAVFVYTQINLFSSNAGGDYVSPLTGGFVLGQAQSNGAGTWTRQELPAAVPLPPALALLAAGLGMFGWAGRRGARG